MEECLKEELTFQEKDEQNLLFEEGEINIYPVSELPIPGGIVNAKKLFCLNFKSFIFGINRVFQLYSRLLLKSIKNTQHR